MAINFGILILVNYLRSFSTRAEETGWFSSDCEVELFLFYYLESNSHLVREEFNNSRLLDSTAANGLGLIIQKMNKYRPKKLTYERLAKK